MSTAAPAEPRPPIEPLHDLTTPDGVIAELEHIRSQLDRMEALYEHRRAVFRAGRAIDPKVTHARMGEASGVSEVLVINQLKPKPAKGGVKRDRAPRVPK